MAIEGNLIKKSLNYNKLNTYIVNNWFFFQYLVACIKILFTHSN
jgi:hypothetical protein